MKNTINLISLLNEEYQYSLHLLNHCTLTDLKDAEDINERIVQEFYFNTSLIENASDADDYIITFREQLAESLRKAIFYIKRDYIVREYQRHVDANDADVESYTEFVTELMTEDFFNYLFWHTDLLFYEADKNKVTFRNTKTNEFVTFAESDVYI